VLSLLIKGENKMRLKIASFVLIFVLVAAVFVAGCASIQNPTSGGQTSKVKAFSDALVNTVKSNLGPNETMVSSKVVENGTDATRVTFIVQNTTPQGQVNPNGTTATLSADVKQFPTKEDATSFYDNVSFGHTNLNKNESGMTPLQPKIVEPYEETMGHAPTIVNGSYKADNLSLANGQGSIALQGDEFVIWGQISWVQK
jgi:archaellin